MSKPLAEKRKRVSEERGSHGIQTRIELMNLVMCKEHLKVMWIKSLLFNFLITRASTNIQCKTSKKFKLTTQMLERLSKV